MTHEMSIRSASLGLLSLLAGGCGGPVVEVTGILDDGVLDAQVAGAQVCLLDNDDVECATTDSAGVYTLVDVPGDAEHAVLVTKDGWVTAIGGFTTEEENLELARGATVEDGWANAQFQLFGIDRDLAKGHIAAYFDDGIDGNGEAVSGVTLSLSPSGGEGPIYLTGGLPDDEATATTEGGAAGVYNLDPGEYTVSIDGLPDGCVLDWGWGTPSEVRIPIRTDALTALWVTCGQ
jgi:hypothetical protein